MFQRKNQQLNNSQNSNHKKWWVVAKILGGVIVFGGIYFFYKSINPYPYNKIKIVPNFVPSLTNSERVDKVFSVKQINEILKTNSKLLKNKEVQIKGYVVDGVRGLGCEDYEVLTDYENVSLYKRKYDKNLTLKEKLKIAKMPLLKTGQTLTHHGDKNFYPTVYAIYEGHFYDDWVSKKCKDGYKRFVIDKKIKEIVPDKNFAEMSETINSGCLIKDGRPIIKPLKVELKNNVIRVNGFLYEPSKEDQIGNITLTTNQQRINKYNYLIEYLKKNKIIIYGGNRYESGGGVCSDEKLIRINKIITNKTISDAQKKEGLKKIFNNNPLIYIYNDILKNWSFDESVLYQCPQENEMYQGNYLDCQPPFSIKKYCQPKYREWINKNCGKINFVN